MIIDEIHAAIQAALPDADVHISDPMNDQTHFEAIVICPQFEGLSLVKQHQLVMKSLTQGFATNVHALALKTFTPTQWASQ